MLIKTQIKNVFSDRERPCERKKGSNYIPTYTHSFLTHTHLHELLVEFRVHECNVSRNIFIQNKREHRSHCVDGGIAVCVCVCMCVCVRVSECVCVCVYVCE